MSDKDSGFMQAVEVKLEYIKRDVADIKTRLDAQYVTVQEFEPVKKIVYGMVGLILVAVVGAIIALVIKT